MSINHEHSSRELGRGFSIRFNKLRGVVCPILVAWRSQQFSPQARLDDLRFDVPNDDARVLRACHQMIGVFWHHHACYRATVTWNGKRGKKPLSELTGNRHRKLIVTCQELKIIQVFTGKLVEHVFLWHRFQIALIINGFSVVLLPRLRFEAKASWDLGAPFELLTFFYLTMLHDELRT